ncbi:MAG: hypothetical protein CL820_05815 [Croceicoccus sp.]|nr:hypothetical protein [Croceicoccus sp.]
MRVNSALMPIDAETIKAADSPMQALRLAQAPRGLAKTRNGSRCQAPAVKGRKRCRMSDHFSRVTSVFLPL